MACWARDVVSDLMNSLTRPVTALCCMRCGGTKRTLRRVDLPVKGRVCAWCVKATNSAVLKVGARGKGRVLVGPMADILSGMKAKR